MLSRLFIKRYIFGAGKGSIVKTLAFLSVAGIGLGVMAMVVVLSVMNGFDKAIEKRLLGVSPHLVVTTNTTEDRAAIEAAVPKDASVQAFAKQDVIIRTIDGIFSGAVAYGQESGAMKTLIKKVKHNVEVFDSANQGAIATAKNEPTEIDFNLKPKEIAVGADLARSLGIYEDDEVTLVAPETLLLPSGELPIYEKVRVKALVRTDLSDIDAHTIFYDVSKGLKRLRETASLEQGFEVRLQHPQEAFTVAAQLKKSPSRFDKVRTWQELSSALFYSLHMEKTLMGVFLGLTILVSSFSVVVVLVLLVTDKRTDVGILKAIGATEKTIRKIFVSIGMALGLMGILGGAGLGLLICEILKNNPRLIKLPDIYYDTTIPVVIQPPVIIGIIILGSVLTFLGTIVPAWRIARTEPIKAIRHDDA